LGRVTIAQDSFGAASPQAGECFGILHRDQNGLLFGGAKGEGEGICIINQSDVPGVLLHCSVGRYCFVKGQVDACTDAGECAEISRVSLATNSPSPSFNCRAARTSDELAICGNPALAALDQVMARIFNELRARLADSQLRSLVERQKSWLRKRAACGARIKCIQDAYEDQVTKYQVEISSAVATQPPPSPPVLGVLKFDGKKPLTLTHGDLVIGIDSEAAPGDNKLRLPVVSGRYKGQPAFSMHLMGDEAAGQELPEAQVFLTKLSPTATEPEVMFTYFTGGAHCCTVTQIATMDQAGDWHVVDAGMLDGGGLEPLDLERNGGAELVSVDNAFLYAFGCYACSYPPTRVQKLEGSQIKDVTRDDRYRDFLRQRLLQTEAGARKSGDRDTLRSTGYLGGWVAAKALVGEFADAWQTMLTTFEPNSDWPMEECAKPVALEQCPDSERRKVDFPHALASLLAANGYITDDERKKLAYNVLPRSLGGQPQVRPANDSTSPLGLCGQAIEDPLKPMIIDELIAGGKHIAPDWTAAIKQEILGDYGSFVTVRNDATVENVDDRTGKIGCSVTYQADLQGLAEKVLEAGATARAQILVRQIAQSGKTISRRVAYTVQKTSGNSLLVQFGLTARR
jgi:uncharacterized protein YecT (DUF1311 family)